MTTNASLSDEVLGRLKEAAKERAFAQEILDALDTAAGENTALRARVAALERELSEAQGIIWAKEEQIKDRNVALDSCLDRVIALSKQRDDLQAQAKWTQSVINEGTTLHAVRNELKRLAARKP